MDCLDLFEVFLSKHKPQLILSGVPEYFWKTLYDKLTNQVFDADSTFSLLFVDYENDTKTSEDPIWTVIVSKEEGVKTNDPSEIYLIDHAWTYRTNVARSNLEQYSGLAERMARIMGIPVGDNEEDIEIMINEVLKNMWKYNNTYSINAQGVSVEDRLPIWYVMDELGSGINHSDDPNFRLIPFMYFDEGITYSLLFPIKDSNDNDRVTRNFVESHGNSILEKNALLLPWKYTNFSNENCNYKKVDKDYFLEGHIEEILPEIQSTPVIDRNKPLKVFSQYDLINQFLTDDSFDVVANEEDADILWYTSHFKDFKTFSEVYPNKFINQFPFENVITIKDLLSIVCRRVGKDGINEDTLESHPKWLPTTFNLKTELVNFVSYYQRRQMKGLDNHWIVKPWNLARGLDIHITNDITYLMRLALTPPKIAQKYIENPVLFKRPDMIGNVKFDIRYVILLKSTEPLQAFIYKNFFLRFSNKAFVLDRFDDYERHFTVMNYNEFNLKHIKCDEFLKLWNEQYPEFNWNQIELNICEMLKEMLIGATSEPPPSGISSNEQSRALYAADIMLAWENGKIQPKLLEVNWVPDCKRACDYYPDFFNDIFKLLFLDEFNENVFRDIQ